MKVDPLVTTWPLAVPCTEALEQLSDATGIWYEATAEQLLPVPVNDIDDGHVVVNIGAVESVKLSVCTHELVSPDTGSFAIHVLDTILPLGQLPALEMTSENVTLGVPQLALPAEAVAKPAILGETTPLVGQLVYVAGQFIEGGTVQVGALQVTVTRNEAVFVFPQLSTAV